jgi:hypothetical protein
VQEPVPASPRDLLGLIGAFRHAPSFTR